MQFTTSLLSFALKNIVQPYTFKKMSEEKIDNLLPEENTTDGNQNLNTIESVENQTENNIEAEEVSTISMEDTEIVADTEVEAPIAEKLDSETTPDNEFEENENLEEETNCQTSQEENIVELTDEQVANENLVIEDETDLAMNIIANANAEESEDETIAARHDIPMQDYEAMPMEQLVAELEQLTATEKIMSVREHVEEVRKAFMQKFYHLIDEKKDEFYAENPDTTQEFHYDFPLKSKFESLYTQYKNKKNAHFKALQNNLKSNLENRMALVEELKNLVHNPTGSIASSLKQLNDIRDRWKNAGPIPKDKYNLVWNNFHFHIENFYDYLHLDRDARDQDFKNNLEQKQRIITRAEELLNETDINKSFRELQNLHRIWKEEIGPVSREKREEIWTKFSEITKQLHDKRETFFESFKAKENENLALKQEIIAQLDQISQEKVESHSAWQGQIEKIDALRNQFFAIGKVPSEVNEQTWGAFKTAVRNFNILKNSFYKEIKKDQNDNLSKKQALVARANELKDSEDYATTTPLMKQIQEEWKTVGHVPRKFSDKLWKEFKTACNQYFDKLKESRKEEDAVELAAFESKKEYLETIKTFELNGNHKEDLDAIKAHIEKWKSFGKVPFNKRHIEGKFNKILDTLFEGLSSSKKEGEAARYANRLDTLASADDKRKFDNEKMFILKKVDEIQKEIFQLENNIQFFSNAKDDNPMLKEIRKNIDNHKAELQTWKDKLKQINNFMKNE